MNHPCMSVNYLAIDYTASSNSHNLDVASVFLAVAIVKQNIN